MARRIGQRDVLWLSLLSGAFVVLAIQIFLGATSGFDRPHTNLFVRLLESPGIVLGWGGAALCVVAIPYALVSWTRGRSPGKVLAVLGTVVCAVGVAGLAGVLAGANHVRGGGAVGGALAHLLVDAMGSVLAFIVMLAIAIPGLLLALGPLMLDTSPVGPARPKRPEAKPWYPKPQVGDDGLEVPMKLPGTDVGPIRYREPEPDPEPAPATLASPASPDSASSDASAAAAAPADAEPAARPPARPKARPIAGVRYADGGDDDGTAIAEVADAPTRAAAPPADASLPFGVRYAAPLAPLEEPAPPPEPEAPAPLPPSESEVASEAPFVSEAAVAATPASEFAGGAAPGIAPVVDAEPESPRPRRAPKPPKAPRAAPTSKPGEEPATPAPAASAEPQAPVAPAVAESAPSIPASSQPSVASHRESFATSGVFERGRPGGAHGGRAPMPKPKPAKPQSLKEALRGLFTNLPVDELPPARSPLADDDDPPKAPAPAPDAPGQLTLFAAPSPGSASGSMAKAAVAHPAAADDLFPAAVDAALERGTASLVLLKRKLNIGYARAASLMEALVSEGILGEMTASGSRPTLLSAAEWAKRKKA